MIIAYCGDGEFQKNELTLLQRKIRQMKSLIADIALYIPTFGLSRE